MKIHEYQAKELMGARGIAVPAGTMATTVTEARAAVRPLVESSGNPVVVVKSQIHAGGRGKGRFVEHPDLGEERPADHDGGGGRSTAAPIAAHPFLLPTIPTPPPRTAEI